MDLLNIILTSRSLCQSRPVSMPELAGLYARAGQSLCQSRPVSMPEPAGLYAGQPLFDCVAVPSGVFFRKKKASPQQKNVCIKKMMYVCNCGQMLT